MKHLGDISKINGGTVAPVDIITFGSPCQDLSVAGKQAGLQHNDLGNEGETRSGLFMEAVRIIKEMRIATNGQQPRFAIWENVPGAFSSNKGADFQTVIHELCKITEPQAPTVVVPKAGWPSAGQFTDVGGGSLAWRLIDAQFHGVPQRRRRIILVCDFTGQCAGNILFKPGGLPGYPTPGVCEGETAPRAFDVRTDNAVLGFAYKASPASGSVGAALDIAPTLLGERNDAAVCLEEHGGADDMTGTLRAEMHGRPPMVIQGNVIGRSDENGPQGSGINGGISFTLNATDRHAVVIESHPQDSRVKINPDGIVQTLPGQMGTGGGNVPLVMLDEQPRAYREGGFAAYKEGVGTLRATGGTYGGGVKH